ncbi:alcohol dehydrogenase catalytic domain-containing protein [Gordonia sp. zg691]|uniref:alcohol dehydrogenase catalytic domain-containing protein n=1 Tax=Gordonia jinghuaiqii TaxID=2758710 RepID=UPI0016623982|nr:alcohol dehydrogenase catalytic domain-containing protein [Gordonia jinghuaiqii]MBD0860355.1 alcohol dehydrogenase catalytic domain-containing protein [Gordonia jinghuaiqii]
MRAAVMWGPGKPFEVQEIDIAAPAPGQVSVDLHSCGVCASDLSLTTAFGQPTPVVLGHEGAGIVTEVGEGVGSVAPGDHVVLVWVPPCGKCAPCRRGDDYLCANRRSSADKRAGKGAAWASPLSVDGTTIHQGMATSTFAQKTVVPANAVVRIDDDVPFPVAAMMGCAVPTGVGAALRSAKVSPGDNVAVIGCGAVGLNAVMGAVVAGAARVVAVDPMVDRQELAVRVGATEGLAPDQLDQLRDLDVVIDAVGAPSTVAAAWKAVRRGGTVTVVGAGRPDQVVEINAYELFHDDKKLTGSFHGGISMHRDLPILVGLWRSGRLPIEELITTTADLTEINEVVHAQQSGGALRILLNPQP